MALNCTVCGSRNYKTTKKPDRDLVEMRKFCKTCGRHTVHRETK